MPPPLLPSDGLSLAPNPVAVGSHHRSLTYNTQRHLRVTDDNFSYTPLSDASARLIHHSDAQPAARPTLSAGRGRLSSHTAVQFGLQPCHWRSAATAPSASMLDTSLSSANAFNHPRQPHTGQLWFAYAAVVIYAVAVPGLIGVHNPLAAAGWAVACAICICWVLLLRKENQWRRMENLEVAQQFDIDPCQ